MKKKLKIDLEKKKEVHKEYIKTTQFANRPRVLLIVAAIFTVILLVYGFAFENTFIMDGEKDAILIWGIIMMVDIILVFLWVITKIAIFRGTGKYISERVNESLILEDSVLKYGYQNFAGATEEDRVVVTLSLEQNHITYNPLIKQLTFEGTLNSTYYDNYQTRETRADGEMKQGTFVLFDYFKPSLVDTLKEMGMTLEEQA